MANEEINIKNFLDERLNDIKTLEKAINKSRKKTMLFQRLPFYKRRRARSNIRKKVKKCRHRDRHFLKTHIWYAKRFKMIKLNKISLPYKRNIKSEKYIYKSQSRGFFIDESYKNIFVFYLQKYKLKNETCGINYDLKDTFQLIKYDTEFKEIIVTNNLIIEITCFNFEEDLQTQVEKGLIETKIDSCISLMKTDDMNLASFISGIEENFTKEVPFFVKSGLEHEHGKIFLKRSDILEVWQKLIKLGSIPVCIQELDRIGIENGCMIYPFDYVTTSLYKIYDDELNRQIIEKYDRTPKSKKVLINTSDLYIHTNKAFYYFFELEKGSLKKSAFVYNSDKEVLGRVIHSAFCFTRGRTRGFLYLDRKVEIDHELYGKNYDCSNIHRMKLLQYHDV